MLVGLTLVLPQGSAARVVSITCPDCANDQQERVWSGEEGVTSTQGSPMGSHLAAPCRFITRKGREVCANPENDWVQDYMNKLELN